MIGTCLSCAFKGLTLYDIQGLTLCIGGFALMCYSVNVLLYFSFVEDLVYFSFSLRHYCHQDGQQSNRKRMYVSDGEDNEAELDHKDKRSKLEVGLGSDEEMNGFGEDADDDVGDLFETVCCICDNGGEVTG